MQGYLSPPSPYVRRLDFRASYSAFPKIFCSSKYFSGDFLFIWITAQSRRYNYIGLRGLLPPCSRKQKSDTEKPRSAHCSAVFPFPQNQLSQAFRDFQANFRRKKQSYAAYLAIAVPAFFKVGNAPSAKFHTLSSQPSVEVWNETDRNVVRSSSVPKVLLAVE